MNCDVVQTVQSSLLVLVLFRRYNVLDGGLEEVLFK